jgi:hypothetical protein
MEILSALLMPLTYFRTVLCADRTSIYLDTLTFLAEQSYEDRIVQLSRIICLTRHFKSSTSEYFHFFLTHFPYVNIEIK